MIVLPRLYAIVDAGRFAAAKSPPVAMTGFARELLAAGVTLFQYRNKNGSLVEMLSQARELRRVAASGMLRLQGVSAEDQVRLVMNDRADLCLAAGFNAVHVGQDDISPEAARRVVGPERWVGVSTHNPEQVSQADQQPVDYIAVGPVFATASKINPDPVIGLEGVRRARALTRKPLVAIGGITRANCRAVIQAGADSVAVISDLLREPGRAAQEFLKLLAG
ncbi:MAG: thiamine phosphate synthase [Terriglobales bacterium]